MEILSLIGFILAILLIGWYIEERKEFDEHNRFFGEWLAFIVLLIILSVVLL